MEYSFLRTPGHRGTESTTEKTKPFFSKTNNTAVQAKNEGAFFQAKLNIGQPGDKYEQEADAMADKVVNSSNNNATVQQKKNDTIQRVTLASPEKDERLATAEQRVEEDKMIQSMEEEESMQMMEEEESMQMMEEEESMQMMEEEESMQMMEEEESMQMMEEEESMQMMEEEESMQMMEEEESMQMMEEEESMQMMEEEESMQMMEEEESMQMKDSSSTSSTPQASNQLSSKIDQNKGRGKALPKNTRTEMESAFGADFSGVNIHTGEEARSMTKGVGAQAFATGSDIYFNEGKYKPETSSGKHLLAHELTHVVQQGKAGKK